MIANIEEATTILEGVVSNVMKVEAIRMAVMMDYMMLNVESAQARTKEALELVVDAIEKGDRLLEYLKTGTDVTNREWKISQLAEVNESFKLILESIREIQQSNLNLIHGWGSELGRHH